MYAHSRRAHFLNRLALQASTLAIAAALSAPAAHAADAAAAAVDTGPSTEEIIVTGTRQTGLKAVDSPAPVGGGRLRQPEAGRPRPTWSSRWRRTSRRSRPRSRAATKSPSTCP
ncbi:MAG: hypothetical protein WDN45_15970 [Caulobacteraceae bacterium]